MKNQQNILNIDISKMTKRKLEVLQHALNNKIEELTLLQDYYYGEISEKGYITDEDDKIEKEIWGELAEYFKKHEEVTQKLNELTGTKETQTEQER